MIDRHARRTGPTSWLALAIAVVLVLAGGDALAQRPGAGAPRPRPPTPGPAAENEGEAGGAAEGAPGADGKAEGKQDGDGIVPHPVAAMDAKGEGEAKPWSFSRPYAWPEAVNRLDVAGYLLPQFEYVSLPSAVPRDRHQYGARGSRVGFAIHGVILEGWSYMAHVVVAPAGLDTLSILSPTSAPSVSISVPTGAGTVIDIEEASIAYRPLKWFVSKLGVVRMPFSIAQTTPVPKQMFPFRAPHSGEFQSGADQGLLATFVPFDARLQVNVGAFLGSSLGGAGPNQTVRGPAVAAQVSAHPLGEMSLREGDLGRSPFRFAIGFGSIYRDATLLDQTGYEASNFNDTRFVAWLRAHWNGIYAHGEYFRRLRTDDLSGRPSVSEGGYGQASYYLPIANKVAFGPLVRAGVVTTNVGFAPRKFTSFEGGIAFYPRADAEEPEKLRILVEYLGASISPIAESQREGLVQLQMEF